MEEFQFNALEVLFHCYPKRMFIHHTDSKTQGDKEADMVFVSDRYRTLTGCSCQFAGWGM